MGRHPSVSGQVKEAGKQATPGDDGTLPQASPRIQVSRDPQVGEVTPLNW